MFPHNLPAISVTKDGIYIPDSDHFFCPFIESMFDEDEFASYEQNITESEVSYKLRHSNRIQTSTSRKTRAIIVLRIETRKIRSRREYAHRSKKMKRAS